jgi:hypothetical protein
MRANGATVENLMLSLSKHEVFDPWDDARHASRLSTVSAVLV